MTRVLALGAAGTGAADIARTTGVPRRTVADWLAGRTPTDRASATILDPGALPCTYVYLLGLYLGDGCISTHARGVHRLRIFLDGAHPGIVGECARAMQEAVPGNAVRRAPRVYHDVEVSAYSKRWPVLLPQHGPGLKHRRPIRLLPWQDALVRERPGLLLRGLIHSDGCRFINTGTNWRCPRYSFSNRSEDILGIFRDACDLFGVRCTTAPHTVYVSRKADVARLDEVIGPKS